MVAVVQVQTRVPSPSAVTGYVGRSNSQLRTPARKASHSPCRKDSTGPPMFSECLI
jgi:hypothetical protein